VEQLTFGDAPAAVTAAVVTGYEIERDLAASGACCVAGVDEVGRGAWAEALVALGPTPYHRLSWSYLDDLPRWRHLKKRRPDIEGQLSLL
jgi:hypothetical protein